MKYRIAMWASVGFLIAGCWAVILLFIPITSTDSFLGTLTRLTQPVVYLHLHLPLRFYWVVLANAATYALLGLFVEGLRQIACGKHLKHHCLT
ncbi:MAG: hypothetical protein WA655_12935 [Candidatus Korobacteraceae bacterium]